MFSGTIEIKNKKLFKTPSPVSEEFINAAIEVAVKKLLRDDEKDGLLCHVTHALPQNRGIDEAAIYSDFFYLEAFLRYKKPGWNKYW